MKKMTRIVAVLALVALAAPLATLADARSRIVVPQLPSIQEGELYKRSEIFPLPDDGDVFPRGGGQLTDQTGERPLGAAETLVSIERGPIVLPQDFNSTTLRLNSASAIPGSGGSSFLTPRVQAKMEIRRLIKRLN